MKKFTNEKMRELAIEAAASIPYSLDMVLYTDGSNAYLSQNSMTRAEFNGEVERLGTIELNEDYWQDTFLDYELDIREDDQTEELTEDLIEHFIVQIECMLDAKRHPQL